MSSKLENLLLEIGNPGRQQILAAVILTFTTTYAISANHLLSLITLTPPHHCTISNELAFKNDSIPYLDDSKAYDSCQMYVNPNNHTNGLKNCDNGYTYHFQDGDRETVATEWELVCENVYLVRIYQTMFFAGVTAGGLTFGYLSDKYGRHLVSVISCGGQLVFGIAVAFLKNFTASCIAMFFRGIFLQGITVAGLILITEICNQNYRTKVTTISFSVPALTMMMVTLYNYPIANWRYQILAHSLTSVISLIGIIFYTKESLRWLLSHNKIDKAYITVMSITKFNGIPQPDNLDNKLKAIVTEIQSSMNSSKKQSLVDVMKVPFLRYMCFIQFFGIFAAQMSVYGFSFLIGEIGGNVHVNLTIASIAELIIRFVGYLMIEKWGRRNTSVMIFAVMSASNFLFTITQHFKYVHSSLGIISLIISIVGRVFNGLYFVSAMIMCTELSPTTVRSSIFGALNTTGRLGLVFLPFLLMLGDYIWKQLPFVIFGILSLVSAILFSFLPETKGRIIPNTIEEVLHLKLGRNQSAKQNDANSHAPDITIPMLNTNSTLNKI